MCKPRECVQCGLLLREIEVLKTQNNRNKVLFQVSESRFRDKNETVFEMQKELDIKDAKLKEQSEELKRLEEQLEDQVMYSESLEEVISDIKKMQTITRS